MTLTGGKSLTTQTDAGDNCSFAKLPAGRTYPVTPSKAGLGFQPASQTFTNILANQVANFIALPNVQFSVGSYIANETDGKATVTVVRTTGASGPASIDYETSDGTAQQ